jgi:hypothetical protein
MKKRPYAKARTTATSSRRDRLRGQMARMDAKMKAKKAEAAKKAAARKAAPAKKKPLATLGQDKKRRPSTKKVAAKTPVPASTTASKGAGNRARNQAASKITGRKMTRAGEYKTFANDSSAAKNFRSAFATARKAGKKTFTWNGKKYTTKTK